MLCVICGNAEPEDFKSTTNDICDRCKGILDYWFSEALNDINTTSYAHMGKRISSKEFAKITEVYARMKGSEEHDSNKDRK